MTAGVRQIVRFNWPFYAGATSAIAVAMWSLHARVPSTPIRTFTFVATGVVTFWIVGSLGASWLVYDHSELTRWRWVVDLIGRPKSWINIHAGLDQSSPALHRWLGSGGRTFDIFDPAEMTEPSIVRAQRASGIEIESEPADFRRLPAATGSVNAVLLLLSAHELRAETSRLALFGELRRVLADGGKVIVAEHLRDAANFAVFGPGALHFHSRRTWARCFARSGFAIEAERAITPFVRVFVLGRCA
ncbi:MAG TPA: class I SAM-dependent methyltransferase [Vicinamibacterales bacterium]|jgi:SAM-dependent methyltransferase